MKENTNYKEVEIVDNSREENEKALAELFKRMNDEYDEMMNTKVYNDGVNEVIISPDGHITVNINDLNKENISEISKFIGRKVNARSATSKASKAEPDESDYFMWNGIRACSLDFVNKPSAFILEDGRVFRRKLNTVKLMKPFKVGETWCVAISEYGTNRFNIHTLVARCFLPNPNHHSFVGFKDGDRNNYNASNLMWIANTEGRAVGTALYAKKRLRPIECWSVDRKMKICTYSSAKEACRLHGYNNSNISACLQGKTKSAYKFWWCYQGEYQPNEDEKE